MKEKKVFIAFSNLISSDPLADYGVNLAKNLNRAALLYYGIPLTEFYTRAVSITGSSRPVILEEESLRKISEEKMKYLYEGTLKNYDRLSYAVEFGPTESTLISLTETLPPHIVVLESDNEFTSLHEWFGTYETRLAENIEAPVLVLPKNYAWKPVKNILYIMDLDDDKVDNVRFLSDASKQLGAYLSVIVLSNEVNNDDEKYNRMTDVMGNLLGYTNVNFQRVHIDESTDTTDQLIQYLDGDWFVFQHRNRSFLERMLNDYNTKRLILQSEIPVLVF